ncbi:hypothetical protein SAMN04515692_10251 [Leifsonia sp. CL147]|nr:hypothetical protein SAMN04515692_10251 [Leifsonia sp. CL147]
MVEVAALGREALIGAGEDDERVFGCGLSFAAEARESNAQFVGEVGAVAACGAVLAAEAGGVLRAPGALDEGGHS